MSDETTPALHPDLFAQLAATDPFQGRARRLFERGQILAVNGNQADVRVGDRVVTSGTDGLYPRGIPIGSVVAAEPGTDLFHHIRLAPAVDFGLLDQVFILMGDSSPEHLKGISSASP